MFDTLSGKLQGAFKNLRGLGKISEENVAESLREVRLALLEADVNFKVAKGFIASVKEKSLGEEVLASVQPGQQIVKIIHDELVTLLGDTNAQLETGGNPSCLMMVGLHGAGKTTSSGKLAKLLKKQGRKPMLVAGDERGAVHMVWRNGTARGAAGGGAGDDWDVSQARAGATTWPRSSRWGRSLTTRGPG